MQCWNCLCELDAEASFCPNCGMDQVNRKVASSQLLICPTCGEAFPESDVTPDAKALECPACLRRHEEERAREDERRELEREKLLNSERFDIRNERSADRFEVVRSFVRVSKLGLTAVLLRKEQKQMVPLIDLSTTGLQCEPEGDFEPGDAVRLELLVPAFGHPLELQGRVRWAESARGGRTRLGIRFDNVDDHASRHLNALSQHRALREAAILLEEKKASSASMPKITEEMIHNRPADF